MNCFNINKPEQTPENTQEYFDIFQGIWAINECTSVAVCGSNFFSKKKEFREAYNVYKFTTNNQIVNKVNYLMFASYTLSRWGPTKTALFLDI